MNISNETQNDETITTIQEKDGDTYEDENSKSPLIPDSKIEENKKYMQEFLEKVKKNGITSNDITELFLKIKESNIEIKELTEDQVKSLIDACELDGISGEISVGNGNGETKREKVELLSTTIPNPSIRRNLIEAGFCGEIVENQLTISDIEKKIESIFSEMIHRIINEGKHIKEVNNSIERYGGYFVHMLNKFVTEIEKIAEKEGINITEEKIDSNKLNGYYEYSENTIKDSIDKNINETGNTSDLEGNTAPKGVGEVAEQIKEKFIKSNEGEKYFRISNIYSQLNKKQQSVMKNLDITIRKTIWKIHLYLEKIEHRYNNTEHTNHALQNLMHRFNETLYFFYERKDIPYRVPREEYGEIGEMGKGTFKEYGRTMFKGLKMDEINGTEIDKKINESRHKLTDKLFECMFDQYLDNPLQFNSHGFDHSILVDGYIQTIIDKDIIKTVRDKYIVSEDEKLVDESTDKIIDNLANFIVRFTAICHDFGYPVSSGYDKCTHGPMGGKLFLDKISLPLKNFLTNVFRKCNLNDSQQKITKIIHDMYESIYYHSADKKGENYQIKIEGINSQDEDVINNERERWGSLLLKGNANASPTQIEQFLKFNSYIISYCDIKNEYPDGEYMGIYNGEERKIVVIDGKYNLIKKGGTEIETEETWKGEEKSIGINAISERISDGKQQAIKLGISLSKNWSNLKIKVKDGNNKIKEFILHNAEINYEEIKDGTEIEISGGNNNKIIIMQDNNKSIYNGRTLDKKGRYGTFGLEYQSRDLDEDPVFSAVRLADNLDMSFNRLTPVQTNPALLNLLYNIIPGIGTGLGELYGLLNDYNNEKDGTKKDKILDKIKTYGIVKYDNEKNEIFINTDLYIYDTKCGEVKYEKEKNKVQKIKMKKILKIGEKFDLADLKKYIYNLMYYHGECNPAIKEISESVTECGTFGQEEIKHMLGLTPIQDIVFDNEKNCIEVKVDENIFNNELFKKIIKEKSKGTYLEIPLREYHMWRLVAAIKAIPYKGTLPSITIVTGKNKKQIGTINPIEFPFKVIYSTEDKKSVDGNSN